MSTGVRWPSQLIVFGRHGGTPAPRWTVPRNRPTRRRRCRRRSRALNTGDTRRGVVFSENFLYDARCSPHRIPYGRRKKFPSSVPPFERVSATFFFFPPHRRHPPPTHGRGLRPPDAGQRHRRRVLGLLPGTLPAAAATSAVRSPAPGPRTAHGRA